ncbi:response regulator transcription factor [Phocaeicola sp.]|uniref:response regulator transcription factor n=1 Tax=Phocaeicola sp. TaxID=2773926 RepID=UPI0023BBA40E|nr:response regulator transcription factor [Phocaeicola sp.]MDE5678548.1 response regulator transcription factor [Phocaeicola sp.]
MKRTEPVHVAVAETSVIVRSGLVAVLKRLPDLTIQSVEITSPDGLQNCMQGHQLDVLIISPAFGGWFNVDEFKSNYPQSSTKCVSLLCSVTDTNLLKGYDGSIALYDSIEMLNEKLVNLMNLDGDEADGEQEALSQREKEIICCVVRGMTNKETAEKLFLSIHTVITHRRNIARKLQIHSPAGLTIYAIVNKLVELSEVKMNL